MSHEMKQQTPNGDAEERQQAEQGNQEERDMKRWWRRQSELVDELYVVHVVIFSKQNTHKTEDVLLQRLAKTTWTTNS